MIEAPVSRRGSFALWHDPGGGRFLGDLLAGSLKATRELARRFARRGIFARKTAQIGNELNENEVDGDLEKECEVDHS